MKILTSVVSLLYILNVVNAKDLTCISIKYQDTNRFISG